MSIFNSVLGSFSPKFRGSFEDPHARDHELPLFHSPSSTSPRIPPPIASTVLWSPPNASLSLPSHVPDELLALQRKARHLEQQLQELLDAQADGLMNELAVEDDSPADESRSNGSTTPTVSSLHNQARDSQTGDHGRPRRKKTVGLSVARRGICRRIQQLALVKAEEKELLDEDLQEVETVLEKTQAWSQKRARLEKRIKEIEDETSRPQTRTLHDEASHLELEIRLKEEELRALRLRYRNVRAEIDDSENFVGAKVSSYKTSLSILNKEIAEFLSKPPNSKHVSLSSSSFLSLPPSRRTLRMAVDHWHEEQLRLSEHCEEVGKDRAALDEGAVLWNAVVKKVSEFEASLQDQMQQAAADRSGLLDKMQATTVYLEEKLELAQSRSWNLLVCAIGAELEAFKQGRSILEHALGVSRKGKEKVSSLVDTESVSDTVSEEAGLSSNLGDSRSPSRPPAGLNSNFFDEDDEDPDPELMVSHQDTDTD